MSLTRHLPATAKPSSSQVNLLPILLAGAYVCMHLMVAKFWMSNCINFGRTKNFQTLCTRNGNCIIHMHFCVYSSPKMTLAGANFQSPHHAVVPSYFCVYFKCKGGSQLFFITLLSLLNSCNLGESIREIV